MKRGALILVAATVGCLPQIEAESHPAMTSITASGSSSDAVETSGDTFSTETGTGEPSDEGSGEAPSGQDASGEDSSSGDSSGGEPGEPAATVEFTADAIELGTTLWLDLPLQALDEDGHPTDVGDVSFEVSDPELLEIDADTWQAHGLAFGSVSITATVGDSSDTLEVELHQGWTQLQTGFMHSCGTDGEGRVHCWGCNTNGMVGAPADWAGGRLVHPRPARIEGLHAREGGLAVGHKFNCAAGEDDTLRCWGFMEDAGLGQTSDGIPIEIDGGEDVVQLDVGYQHALGLHANGSLYAFGRNVDGELGDGTQDNRASFVPIAPELSFVHVTAGGESDGLTAAHSCAITDDGALYCWGANGYGQVGNGSPGGVVTTPTLIELPGGAAIDVDAGAFHTCAVDEAGDAYCWGGDHQRKGVLGTGAPSEQEPLDFPSPSLVVGGHTFTQVVAGFRHSAALTTEGQVMSWGNGELGLLGTDDALWRQTSPIAVPELDDVVSLDGYTKHTCAIDRYGIARCFGQNFTNYNGTNAVPHTYAPTRLLDPDLGADLGPEHGNCIYVEPPWEQGVDEGVYGPLPE